MNRQQFISFLESPLHLGSGDSAMLEGVIREFPYFQTAHLLHLKSLHNQNSIHFNNRLKLVAAYAGDRKLLRELVNLKIANPVSPKVEPVHQVEILLSKADKHEEASLKQEIADKADVKAQLPDIKPATPETKHLSGLEQDILIEAINASINIEVDQAIDEAEKAQHKPKAQPVEATPIAANFDSSKKHSFAEWLKASTKHTGSESLATSSKNEEDKTRITELVDRFIKEEPRITRPKTEFYNPVNMAKQSIIGDKNLVTETLAKIYERQGNYVRAIESYEILSLKYPEKKTIFAARIAEIKKHTNL